MALFIQSANSLVSRVAQWVGAIPSSIGVSASSYVSATGVITTSVDPTPFLIVGDFIGNSGWRRGLGHFSGCQCIESGTVV